MLVGPQQLLDQQALDMKEPHVLEPVSEKQNGAVLAADGPVSFGRQRRAVQRRAAGPSAEFVDRISIRIEPLDDAKRPAVERRAEETRDRRVPLVTEAHSQRRKMTRAVTQEPRVYEI